MWCFLLSDGERSDGASSADLSCRGRRNKLHADKHAALPFLLPGFAAGRAGGGGGTAPLIPSASTLPVLGLNPTFPLLPCMEGDQRLPLPFPYLPSALLALLGTARAAGAARCLPTLLGPVLVPKPARWGFSLSVATAASEISTACLVDLYLCWGYRLNPCSVTTLHYTSSNTVTAVRVLSSDM